MSSPDSKKKLSTGGIRTLSDLNHPSTQDSNNNDSNNPQQHNIVVEKSEMLDQDPSKKIDVDSIFSGFSQNGVAQQRRESVVSSSRSRSITGIGRTLAGEIVSPPTPQPPEFIAHTIIFWRNGFTVNGGPLRGMNDPENALFLESIAKAECPTELAPADLRTRVHCKLIKKTYEDFTEPKKPQVPFSGVGRILGSNSSSEPSIFSPINTQTPSMDILDESSPSTLLQLKLADGTPVIGQFNYNHTIGDIRAFIDASRPNSTNAYQLQTVGFPPIILNDSTQTIEQAGLANSVVRQKM